VLVEVVSSGGHLLIWTLDELVVVQQLP